MCYFLTLGVPARFADALTAPRGFEIYPTQNRSVLAQLPRGFQTCLLVSGMCSCGLYHRQSKQGRNPAEFLRRKYKKKGWSEARIQRAIDQATRHREAQGRIDFVGLHPDAAEIVAAAARAAGRVAVIAHFYNREIDKEAITLSAPRSIAADELLASSFPFDEDELIWVTGSRAGGPLNGI